MMISSSLPFQIGFTPRPVGGGPRRRVRHWYNYFALQIRVASSLGNVIMVSCNERCFTIYTVMIMHMAVQCQRDIVSG